VFAAPNDASGGREVGSRADERDWQPNSTRASPKGRAKRLPVSAIAPPDQPADPDRRRQIGHLARTSVKNTEDRNDDQDVQATADERLRVTAGHYQPYMGG
jgi:hypothetical protein